MKKVLIISYYWPPSGGIGVLRCLKIAKYLRQYGWEPIVYTAENAHYPWLDNSNFKDIPPGMTVLKHPIFEPYAYYKKFLGKPADANVNNDLVASGRSDWKYKLSVFIRSNFFIPDARALWIKPSVKFLLNWLKNNQVDAILSDGPPHTNTVIACKIRQATGLPWLADFQDPWTQVDYYQRLILTPWADAKHRRMEQEAFRTANVTTIVSPTWKRDLESIGARNVHVIPWGYDEDDFKELHYAPDWKLTLTHAGLIGEDRNPEQLFAAMAELAQEEPAFRQVFVLRLFGQVDTSVQQAIARYQVQDMTEILPAVNRAESLKRLVNSQALLLILNKADNAKGRIPGKLFEYLAAKRPVLCIGDVGSDTDHILQQCEAGRCVAHADKESIKAALRYFFITYKQHGNLPSTTNDQVNQYTNRRLTGQFAALLDRIIAPSIS
ncbi:MAG: glycosyltransferase [Cytophagales bacterium]|nr:glycosyltransferase [Bernardetiaceae bacterium]MDW8205660.1 glycosyltransferase [Cytophagales bacterium]